MTGATWPARGFRLPRGSRDAHTAAAAAMLHRLAGSFPDAGLGIAGSVATGTHGPASDLDLVVVDASFRREMQFATVSEGIRTAIVCLRPDLDAEREKRWMLGAGGDAVIVSMVRGAFVARDPAGHFDSMQRTVARLDAARRTRSDELVDLWREHAFTAMRMLRSGGGAGVEHLQLELFAAIVGGWVLRQGLVVDTRRTDEQMLDTIAGRDAPLSALLREAVPLTRASTAPLLQAAGHVFGPAPPGE
jgi:hypothetical protein